LKKERLFGVRLIVLVTGIKFCTAIEGLGTKISQLHFLKLTMALTKNYFAIMQNIL